MVPELLIPRMYENWLLKYSDHTVKSSDDKITEYGYNCQSCGSLSMNVLVLMKKVGSVASNDQTSTGTKAVSETA